MSESTHALSSDGPLPDDWSAGTGKRARDTAQLVLCEYPPETGAPVRQCHYTESIPDTGKQATVPVVTAKYTYLLREARTGAALASFTLNGTKNDCPYRTESDTIPQTVDAADLVDELRPYVTGER
ncbi:hypothetical protein [Tamaricihabitans halophyticus]|nr:hypothetical protein [Tamaricihabitans halophyticus]